MANLFVAASKTLQEWGADVGLGKNLYALGLAEDGSPEDAVAGLAGQSDWKVLKSETVEGADLADAIARLARKEKMVDPAYYPKLRGATGIFKITIANVENAALVALALDNREPPKNFKIKPADIALFMLKNAR